MGCWRRLLRVPWTVRRSTQSILKEISPECSLEGLMLKLKLQCFGHLMWRTDPFEKTLMLWKTAGGKGDARGWGGGMASPTPWTWVWASSRRWWWTGKPGVLQSMGSQRVRHDWATELNWTKGLYSASICVRAQVQVNTHCLGSWVKSKVRNQDVKVTGLVPRFHFLVRVSIRFQSQTKVLFKFPCQGSYQGSRVKGQVSSGRS